MLAFDQRRRMEELAWAFESTEADIRRFKMIVGLAVERVGKSDNGDAELGVVVDERYGEAVLSRMTHTGWWIARPVEIPGSRPVRFEPRDNMGLPLLSWPKSHVVKCLVQYSTDDPMELRLEQEQLVCQLHADCIDLDRQLLLALVTPAGNEVGGDATITNAHPAFLQPRCVPFLVATRSPDRRRLARNRPRLSRSGTRAVTVSWFWIHLEMTWPGFFEPLLPIRSARALPVGWSPVGGRGAPLVCGRGG